MTGIDRKHPAICWSWPAQRGSDDDADLQMAELGHPIAYPDDTFKDVHGFPGPSLPAELLTGAEPNFHASGRPTEQLVVSI